MGWAQPTKSVLCVAVSLQYCRVVTNAWTLRNQGWLAASCSTCTVRSFSSAAMLATIAATHITPVTTQGNSRSLPMVQQHHNEAST